MSDKIRDSFEVWAKSHYGSMRLGCVQGFYSNELVQDSWFVWQEAWINSRRDLVVALPDSRDNFLDKQVVQHALSQEGIRYE